MDFLQLRPCLGTQRVQDRRKVISAVIKYFFGVLDLSKSTFCIDVLLHHLSVELQNDWGWLEAFVAGNKRTKEFSRCLLDPL